MIKYHINQKGEKTGELVSVNELISNAEDILDFLAEVSFNGCSKMIINSHLLHPDFFDLKTRIAGEILQKFSNYRMKLAIVGDFTGIESKSLRDFIRESNKYGIIKFVSTVEEALI